MAKDPAFLFYPNDWLGGTLGMTFEEKGAYMELLMLQFNRGHMEGHMVGQVVGQIWDKISHKFIQDENGLWYNERLELEKNRRKAFTNSRRNNLKGINQHTKNKGHINGHMTSHMENEDEDIKLKGGVGGDFNFLAEDSAIGEKKKMMYDKLINNQQWHDEIYGTFDIDYATIKREIDKFVRKKFIGISVMEHISEYKRHFINHLIKVGDVKQLTPKQREEKIKCSE
jgi:uncharacterized protein YdaU (DUF1376 family)